jgi:hypothetical protein
MDDVRNDIDDGRKGVRAFFAKVKSEVQAFTRFHDVGRRR